MDRVELHGRLLNTPVCTHTCAGERIFEADLIVPRGSGVEDIIPLMLGEYTLARRLDVMLPGTAVRVIGEIRCYRKNAEGVYKNKIAVFCQRMHMDMVLIGTNKAELSGTVLRAPTYRLTPFGRQITDLKLRAERGHGKVELVPVIAWGRLAQMVGVLEAGENIWCKGRLQSREYIKQTDKGEETRIAYEVSVSAIKTNNAAEPMTEEELKIYG